MISVLIPIAVTITTATAIGGRVFHGGPIYPMTSAPWDTDVASPLVVQALAVKDGRIEYVGDDIAAARSAAGSDAVVVDLAGQALLPAFVDGHSHLSLVAEDLDDVNLWAPKMGGTVTSIAQMIQSLKNHTPTQGWIIGFGYDQTLLKEGRHPTRRELDQVSTEVPVWVRHVAGHSGVANSKALELAGLTRDSKAPPGCRLLKREDGELNGFIEESACIALLEPVFPKFTMAERVEQLEQATKQYLSRGYATAQNGYSLPDQNRALEFAAQHERLHCRVVNLPGGVEHKAMVDAGATKDEVFNVSAGPERLVMGGVKFVADGSVSIRTAFLRKPYDLVVPDMPEGFCAYPHMSTQELIDGFRSFHRAGYKLATHANGDAAVDQVLTALETLQAEEAEAPQGPVIIHSEFTHEDQLDRMKALGASPSFFNLHVFYWWQQWTQWAKAEPTAITPMRGAIDRHLVYSSHTDSPIVDLEPMRILWSAITRRSGRDDGSAGDVIGSSERIDLYEALWGLTAGAARQWDLDMKTGSLRAGLLADLVILDKDPFALREQPDELLHVRVLATLIDGVAGYTTPEQPLDGVAGLKSGKPLLTSLLAERTSSLWGLHEHGDEEPTALAQEERPLGACGTVTKQPRSRFPIWLKLSMAALLCFGGVLLACLVRRVRTSKRGLADAEDLQVSLQEPVSSA